MLTEMEKTMAKSFLAALLVFLFNTPVFSQEFVPCPGDPSIPIDDPACPPDVGLPPAGSSLNSSANSQWMDFNAKFVEEEIRSRESEAEDEELSGKNLGFIFGAKSSSFDQDSVDEFVGFESRMKGVFLGVDYRITPDIFLGAAIDMEREDTDTNQDMGTQDLDEYGFSLYSFLHNQNDVYFSLLARYATQNYEIEQSLSQESPFDETYGVTGKTDGNRRNLSAGAGRDFNFGSEEITISALLEFDRTTIDSHTLSSDLGSVDIDEDERTLLTFSLGGQASKTFGTNAGVFIPSVSLHWFHEFKDNPRAISGIIRPNTLGVSEGQITIVTPEPDRNYLSVGTNLVAVLPRGFSAYFDFEKHFSRKHIDHWMLTIGGRFEF